MSTLPLRPAHPHQSALQGPRICGGKALSRMFSLSPGTVLPLQAAFSSYSTITRGAVSTGCGPWGSGTTWTSQWVSSQMKGRFEKAASPSSSGGTASEGRQTSMPQSRGQLAVHKPRPYPSKCLSFLTEFRKIHNYTALGWARRGLSCRSCPGG